MSYMQTDLLSWCHLSGNETEIAVLSVHMPNVVTYSLHGVSWIHSEPDNAGNNKFTASVNHNVTLIDRGLAERQTGRQRDKRTINKQTCSFYSTEYAYKN